MPVWVPMTIGIALGITQLKWHVAAFALGILLVFNFTSVLLSAHSEAGIDPQKVADLALKNEDIDHLQIFLEREGYTHGYATYWVSFNLIFRSKEELILDTNLPYDENGYRSHNNRYPQYQISVAQMDDVVWITHNFPELDSFIESLFAQASIRYKTKDFGSLHVYYDFSERVAPGDFNLDSAAPLEILQLENTACSDC